MYDYYLLAQLKQKEVERMAGEAWKRQFTPQKSVLNSVFERLFTKKATAAVECNCACAVC